MRIWSFKPLLLILLPSLLACFAADSYAQISSPAQNQTDGFEAASFRSPQGETLPYRFLKPIPSDSTQTCPLILYLHGAGECGSDNQKQLINFPAVLASDAMRRKYPCYVVAPQVAEDCKWVYMNWLGERGGKAPAKPSRAIRLTLQVIDDLAARYPIDRKRIYVTGISMGGHGVWDILWRRPELFAAAVPVCGGGDLSKAPLIHDIPVWAFHGGDDPVVPVARSRGMIAALRKAGGQPRYTEYPGAGHDAWSRAYADLSLFEWMFAQWRK